MINALQALQLLIPALIPSWRFFDDIAPSPRIEYCLLNDAGTHVGTWEEFRPRPQHISMLKMLRRLFWNPEWNEQLFMVSCAERIARDQTAEHSAREIAARIKEDLRGQSASFQFRIRFVTRDETHVIYISEPEALS